MPHYINHLLLALLLLTTACTSDDSMPNGIIQGPVNDKAQAVYEGNWTIGNYDAGTAEMTASSSGFSFGTIPFAAILRMAIPHSNVSCDNTTGFVVPYTETGISDQAIYMQLNSSMWSTPATIDDQNIMTHTSSGLIVPKYFYIAILSVKNGVYRALGIWSPHATGSKTEYISIDELEKRTGIDFFCNLPDDIEAKVEAEWDPAYWGRP